MSEEHQSWTQRHPAATYSGLRAVLFAVPFLILLALQVPFVWALLVAFLVSAVASIFVLSRFRDQLSISISQRSERIKERMAEREASEDEWDEARRAEVENPKSDDGV